MTFLELCQRLNRESGSISGDAQPSTVVAQIGKLKKTVDWVATAWNDIQLLHDDWLWLQTEFSYEINSPTARYLPASFSLTRFNHWRKADEAPMFIYETSAGVADQGALEWISWDAYRATYLRGTQTADRPQHVAISPAGELCFGPSPDVAHTVSGEYFKSPQIMAANADVPELPGGDAHHILIVWHALLYKYESVGAQVDLANISRRYYGVLDALERQYRPEVTFQHRAGPIA